MSERDARDSGSGALTPTEVDRLYRQVLPGSGQTIKEVARGLLLSPEELTERLAPLVTHGVASIEGGVLRVATPQAAIARFMTDHARMLAEASEEVARLAQAIPALPEGERDRLLPAGEIDGEVSVAGDVPGMLVSWMRTTTGDACFLRPDQWRFPSESEMAVAVRRAVQDGRTVRAIYPTRAIHEAPEVLASRAAVGEQVRIVPEVVTRLAIVGAERAVVPEPLGVHSERRVTVRQPAVVAIFQAWFDLMWDGAADLPTELATQSSAEARRLLLMQLAGGIKDEQIARNLNLSLRTVRRRVAALMQEARVNTRFQLGAEAVRRGWV